MDEFPISESKRKASILINAIWGVIVFVTITFGIALFTLPQNEIRYISLILITWIVGLALRFLTKKGRPRLSAFLFIGFLLLLILGASWSGGGIKGHGIKLMPIIVLLAGLLLENKGVWQFALLASLGELGLVAAEYLQLLPQTEPLGQAPVIHWLYSSSTIFLISFLAYLSVRELRKSLKETQEELALRKKLEEKYRLIFESFPDIYYQSDMEGNLIIISPSVKEYLGYENSEVIGKNVTEFYFNADDRKTFLDELKTKGNVQNYELDLITKAGNVINTIVSSRLIYDEAGVPQIIEGTIHDFTLMKRAEDLLKLQNKKLIEIAFLQAHMVRRPVSSILGLINLVNFNNPNDARNFEIISRLQTAIKEFDASIKEIVEKTTEIETVTQRISENKAS